MMISSDGSSCAFSYSEEPKHKSEDPIECKTTDSITFCRMEVSTGPAELVVVAAMEKDRRWLRYKIERLIMVTSLQRDSATFISLAENGHRILLLNNARQCCRYAVS